jgi:hypothetical protein
MPGSTRGSDGEPRRFTEVMLDEQPLPVAYRMLIVGILGLTMKEGGMEQENKPKLRGSHSTPLT